MASFIVTFGSGRDGEVQTTAFAHTAHKALELAEDSGTAATICVPNGETFDVADFRHALDGGEFDDT